MDCDWLYHWVDLKKRIWIVDWQNRRCHSPSGEIAWPIVYLVGRKLKKCLHLNSKGPNLKKISQGLEAFSNRIKWRWSLKDSENDGKVRRVVKSFERKTPSFKKIPPPELKAWLHEVCRVVQNENKNAMMRGNHEHKCWNNFDRPDRVAWAMLRDSDCYPIPTEKSGGFALIKRLDKESIEKFAIRKP